MIDLFKCHLSSSIRVVNRASTEQSPSQTGDVDSGNDGLNYMKYNGRAHLHVLSSGEEPCPGQC